MCEVRFQTFCKLKIIIIIIIIIIITIIIIIIIIIMNKPAGKSVCETRSKNNSYETILRMNFFFLFGIAAIRFPRHCVVKWVTLPSGVSL